MSFISNQSADLSDAAALSVLKAALLYQCAVISDEPFDHLD